jgi:Domain of unknown function (DUF6268)
MPLPKNIIFLFLFLVCEKSLSQNNSLSQLFYPNITISAQSYSKSSLGLIGSNVDYGLTRRSISGFVPIRSEVQVGIGFRKKLDLKAVHTALAVNVVQNDPSISTSTQQMGYKTASVSVIQMQASLRERLWVYGGGIGFSESNETFFSPRPFFWGGAARMRVLGLHTQILYGTTLVFNQKFRIVPVFGFTKRFGKEWQINGILPFQASVSRKVTDWFNLETKAAMKGYSAGYLQEINSEKVSRRENLQQLNVTLSANFHVLKAFNFSIEGGVTGLKQLNTFDAADKQIFAFKPKLGPYVGVSVRYVTTKSKFSSKFLNKVGIGL